MIMIIKILLFCLKIDFIKQILADSIISVTGIICTFNISMSDISYFSWIIKAIFIFIIWIVIIFGFNLILYKSEMLQLKNFVKRNWKTSLHSFEHALFGYMTASQAKGTDFDLYYALPEWEKPSHKNIAPYMFAAVLTAVSAKEKPDFMPDGNQIYKVTFDSLH